MLQKRRGYPGNVAVRRCGVGAIWVEGQCAMVKKAEFTTKGRTEFRETLCLSEHMKGFNAAVVCKVLGKPLRGAEVAPI